ncbi:MAG: cellulase family glycosylhydrolase [Phenylobacterium sp.]|nr:cellulase family glycosylhydrolase [Phenylobacterium sp.]
MDISPVRQSGPVFLDAAGRQVILRGVNLGGDCKVPFPEGGTNFPSDFSDHREVSFIGRPFPIEEADEHLGRLRHWGFNLLRLLTTWEAVEHAGPGRYDDAYLDYLAEVTRRAGEHGFHVFIDFHQDAWSRMTGGDGAPGWTFEAAGLDFTRFHRAGAAHVMQAKYDYATGGRQEAYPQMSWGGNNRLPAAAIMWTLFWGGRTFTPDLKVDGRNIQDVLQQAYLGSMREVARRVRRLPNVLGFDTLNEPATGWMGERLGYRHLGPSEDNPGRAAPGPALSALDSLAAAQGLTVRVPRLVRDPKTGRSGDTGEVATLNPDRVRIWTGDCPFERAGAYRIVGDRAEALDEEFFRTRGGRRLTISEDGFGPLFRDVAKVTRAENPDWSVFAEIDPYGAAAGRPFPADLPERTVNASHWYDSATLYLKTFDPSSSFDLATGQEATSADEVRERFTHQIAFRTSRPAETFPGGGAPSLLGEFGIPFDLDDGEAYDLWAEGRREPALWNTHVAALSLMYDAIDALQIHSAQWNYTASNRNDLMIGDGWNQEDLSIYSLDQADPALGPDSGGRALEGFCRPYVRATQGRLETVCFDQEHRVFETTWDADPTIHPPTEIYVPAVQFPEGFEVTMDGEASVERHAQFIHVTARRAGPLKLTLRGPAGSGPAES